MVDRSKIGKANRRKGNRFERKVAKTIARAYGWDWKAFADRAGAGHEQKHDILVLDSYAKEFPFYVECKYRKEWSLHDLFKDPENSKIYTWFKECEENTHVEGLYPALAFSRAYAPVFWMFNRECRTKRFIGDTVAHLDDNVKPCMVFQVGGIIYEVMRLDDFLGEWV